MAPGAHEDVDVLLVDLDAPCACTGSTAVDGDPPQDLRGRRRLAVVVAAAALLAVVVGDLLAPGRPAPPPPVAAMTAEQQFTVLSEPQVPGTGLPDVSLAAAVGVAPGSERLVAVAPDASFWVARGSAGRVCVVVVPSRAERARGGACAAPSVVARGLRYTTASGPGAALLPVGSDTSATVRAGYAQLAPGMWVDAGTAERTAVARVRSASWQTVVVPAQGHRGSDELPYMLTTEGTRYAVVLTCLRPAPLRVSVDGEAPERRTCPTGGTVHRFTGRGQPAQVSVEAPDDLVWAAEVVSD